MQPNFDLLIIDNDAHERERLIEVIREVQPSTCVRTFPGTDDLIRTLEEDIAAHPDFRPCLMLLSLDLPGSAGFKLLAALKVHPKLRRIPTITYSIAKAEGLSQMVYDMHANCFLAKPAVDGPATREHFKIALDFWLKVVELPDVDHR